MDNEKIVPIHDCAIHVPGVQQGVINLLCDMLEQAEKGEIVGIAIGAVRANHEIGTFSARGSAAYSALVASVSMCHFELCKHWDDDQ
jgi:hypothetical protein